MTNYQNLPQATSILVEVDDLVLAASRRGDATQLGLIGGKQDPGETIEECAMREFFEETGIKLSKIPEKVFADFSEAGADGRAFYVTTFKVTNENDIANIKYAFLKPREVEEGITISLAPRQKVIDGPFGRYNVRLFNAIGE